jgi:hypothetical protein
MACTPASSEDKSITLPTSSALPPVFNETLPRVPLIESPDATRRLPLPPASEEPVEMLTSPDLAIPEADPVFRIIIPLGIGVDIEAV